MRRHQATFGNWEVKAGRKVELDQEKSEQAIHKVKRPQAPTASMFCFANSIMMSRCRAIAPILAKGLSRLSWK
jgi:hypothetical protein